MNPTGFFANPSHPQRVSTGDVGILPAYMQGFAHSENCSITY